MVDKSAESGNWREKYLDALDTQEKIEKEFKQQQELLRRSLVRVSLSADGQDDKLDSALAFLREGLRNGNGDLLPAFSKVDSALVDFEQQREQTTQGIIQALTDTLNPLQRLPLSRPLSKEIRHYLSQLPQRTQKIRLYPALLQQLAEIQQQALADISAPKTGLWRKLLGKSPGSPNEASSLVINEQSEDLDAVNVSNDVEAISSVVDGAQTEKTINIQLIKEIEILLTNLLRDIDVPEEINAQVEKIQSRLKRGLSHIDVIPALESVRDLVMEAYLLANKTFAMYLKNVNQELADIYSVVGGAVEHHVNRIETAQQLQNSMMQQMTDLESEASDATDLKQLKNMVKSQIGNIREALNHYHQTEMEQQQLSNQLQELAEKIKAMEEEAEKNHTTLEKHRYKSLHDPLTELPNREAYNERIQSEFNRWQRYQHSLSLAVCDLDFFKKINDSFGHQAGDRVLKVISRSIAKRLREVDFFCRYGGEEFVVILPETTLEKATTLLEKIRIAIAGTAFNYKNDPLSITLSIGITQFRQGDSIASAFGRADKALYAAKAEGRNRCKAD